MDDKRPVAVIRAYKGEGKSALLKYVGIRLRAQTPTVLVISVSAPGISPDLDVADSDRWLRAWKASILRLAANEIGSRLSLAFSDDAIALVEEAEQNGFKERSFVSTIADRVASSKVPIERKRVGVVNAEQLLKRWQERGSTVWLLIDDIDQNFENTAIQRFKIAGFFTACRQIASLIPDFKFRLTVRPNVWAALKQEHEALSHVEQYMENLSWSLDDYYDLLGKRLEAYLERGPNWNRVKRTLHPIESQRRRQLIAMVFDDPMPWGRDKKRPPTSILYTLSRHRPRWLVELCKEAAASADRSARDKINFDDINKQLDAFGRRRIDDTIAEFRSQCPEIRELITAFVGEPEWFTTAELVTAIRDRVLQAVHPHIVGLVGNASPTEVAHFLFSIGFLTARRDLGGGDYEHLSFANNPDLLSSRTNIDQGHTWEIHPVFRQPLKLKNVLEH